MNRVRRIGRVIDETEQSKIEELREVLKTYFLHLAELQAKAGINHERGAANLAFVGDDIDWDGQTTITNNNVTNDAGVAYPPVGIFAPEGDQPIEKQMICLPSNGNTHGQFVAEELELRIEQAAKHLAHLRELIADKSFQYSALIRTGNLPQVRTRARTALHEMNAKIAFHVRTYNRVRCRLVMLGADDTTLNQYQLLAREDIAASTAILNYNERGSTTAVRLSWIWQSVTIRIEGNAVENACADATTLLECEYTENIEDALITRLDS